MEQLIIYKWHTSYWKSRSH